MFGPVSGVNDGKTSVPALVGTVACGTLFIYAILTGKNRKHFLPGQRPIMAAIWYALLGGFILFSITTNLEVGGNGASIAAATVFVTLLILGTSDYAERRRFRGSASWPTAMATVETADVRIGGSGRSRSFVADLGYSYTVGGSYYSGRFIKPFANQEAARTFANEVRGKSIRVRFEPTKFEPSEIVDWGGPSV
jgi:hypothetical protein